MLPFSTQGSCVNDQTDKRVVAIVGSKPNPILPRRIDTIVFCNGSIYLLDRPGVRPEVVWHCITNWTLCGEHEAGNLTRAQVRGRNVDMLVEFATLSPERLDYSWESLEYSYTTKTSIENSAKGELTFSVLDARLYLDLWRAPCPVREKISILWNIVARRKKPAASTGILALLFAINHANSANETFVLCGVGLDNDGYAFQRGPAHRGHICMDFCVLRALSRPKYATKVKVTDKRLSELVGLRLSSG